MKQYEGYLKLKLENSVLLSDGNHKSLSDFIGTLQLDPETNTLQYKSANSNSWNDLVLFGTRAFDSTTYLPLSGGTISGLLTVSPTLLNEAGNVMFINCNSIYDSYISYQLSAQLKANIGYSRGLAFVANEYAGGQRIGVSDTGNPEYWTAWNGLRYTLIHTGNYTSYLGTATTANAINITGWGTSQLTYNQTPDTFYGRSGWAHYIICNHGDGATYYNYVIALPFWGAPIYQRMEGGSAKGWQSFITSENVGSYALTKGLNVLEYNNGWLSPSRLQLMRYDGSIFSDRAVIGITNGNLHIDAYHGYNIYLGHYASGGIYFGYLTSSYYFSGGNMYMSNFYAYSDKRLKKNINKISNLLPLYSFDLKDSGKHSYGFIAQEEEKLFPELVSDGEYKTVNYNAALSLYLAKLSNIVEENNNNMKTKIIELEQRLDKLESRGGAK